ncbi:MAG: electron transfer flavoprotein subunit alpha/FixB family protein [Lachnospiraceae bacterium]|nr:electron transfer flavoprotein subunit alpha/FixB family protein [Lachnospiraceae bacterium]
MALSDYKGVYVFAQTTDNKVDGIALELLGKGKALAADLNTEVVAMLLGHEIADQADVLAEYGADKVVLVDHPDLKEYMTEPYTQAISAIIKECKPDIVLFGATAIGRDLAPCVAATVHTGLTADCTKLDIGDFPMTPIPGKETLHNQLLMTRPAFGGNTIATIAIPDFRPQMATVRPGVMQKITPIPNAKANVVNFDAHLTKNDRYVEILEVVKKVSDYVDIQDAKILISGGRGMQNKENYEKYLRPLANLLGGQVSSSRAGVDGFGIPKELQVGQTGKTVRPKLYMACGISGAIQHLAGMEESDLIIAINKDETAPIFEVADYGIVGDLFQIIPPLTQMVEQELKKKQEV